MKIYTIDFMRQPTEHEIAHNQDSGPRVETKTVQAKSKTAAREFGRAIVRAHGWRMLDVREVA